MIVYSETKKSFSQDIFKNRLVDKVLEGLHAKLGRRVSESEVDAWRNSLIYMDIVLRDPEIPDDVGITIEYQIPQTGRRIDFMISGYGDSASGSVVIVELKQWEEAERTEKDGIVRTFVGRAVREVSHPSYQAWSYAALLEDFNETVRTESITLKPCAYLHNYRPDDVITHAFYSDHLEKAPVFLKSDAEQLQQFIKKYVKRGDNREVMYRIEQGRIKPSKSLADSLASMLKGNREFIMIDDQKIVYETAMAMASAAAKSKKSTKQVLIVEGGPGTGKSVVAVNLLVDLVSKSGLTAQYVTKNAAPRAVYESRLTGTMTHTRISNLFTGSGSFTDCEKDVFDVLIVDEAHRLNAKSGLFGNLGENQIKEIIESAKCSIFFIDEDQRVTFKDIGDKESIGQWAKKAGAQVQTAALSSQFRCNGSDGYLAWLDNTLQIKETANIRLSPKDYDFRIMSTPNELRDLIFEKNQISNKARLVAGYCWDWVSKANPDLNDIEIPEHRFGMRWNLKEDGGLWILRPDSVNEVGCIHTCQGLDLDYVGVIVGPDLVCRNEAVVTDASKRSSMDRSIHGYRQLLRLNPGEAKAKADLIIKNTYRTLMTRAVKGCYVYFVDKETEQFFISRLSDR